MSQQNGIYVQYGCGFSAPESWRNFDSSPTLRFERIPMVGQLYSKNVQRFPANVEYGDIVKGLPIPESSCAGLYCSHILEHLALADFEIAIQRSFTYLRSGGIFRLVVPDLETLAQRYVQDPGDEAAESFIRETGLGLSKRPHSPFELLKHWLGAQEHLWMWDQKSLSARLNRVGFVDVRRASYADCEDPRFRDVENAERFEMAVAMQCRRR